MRTKKRKSLQGRSQEPLLTKKQERSLLAQITDLEDPKRYVIESCVGKTLYFYYIVENDTYTVNDLTEATLFKRRKAAEAIVRFLTERDRNPSRKGRFRVVAVVKRGARYVIRK